MDESKINQFMLLHGDKFSEENLFAIKEKLQSLDDSKLALIIAQHYENPKMIFWISFFLGVFGVDRFMIGHTGLGLAKLFLSWATLFLWVLIDWLFFIKKATQTVNYEKFTKATMF